MASIKVLCVALALLATACTSAPPEPATSPSPPAEIDRLPSPAPGRQLGPAMYGHADAASGLDIGTVNGRPVVVTGGGDGLLRIWDLATHELVGAPLPTGQGVLYDVMIMRRDNRDVAVTNGDTLRVWDLGARRALTPPMDTKALLPRLLAVGSAVGTQVALTENSGGEVQRWNLTAGQPLGDPLKGPEGRLQAGAIGRFGDTTVAVTGEEDGVLRAWDLMTGKPVATARTASIEYIHGLGVVQGVVVITGADGGIERWDLATGAVTVQAKDGDSTSVRVDELDGKTVLLVGAHGTLQIVDVATGKAVGHGWDSDDLLDDVAAVGRLGRKRVLAIGDLSGTVSIWDLRTGKQLGQPIGAYGGSIRSIGATLLHGKPVAVTAGDDDTVRVWDLTRHRQLGAAIDCACVEHAPMAVTTRGGKPVAVIADIDGVIVRDLATGRKVDQARFRVYARARMSADGPVVAAITREGKAVIWDLSGKGGLRTWKEGERVDAVAVGRGLAATASGGRIQLSNQATGERYGQPITSATEIEAMAIGQVGDRTILFARSRYAPEYGYVRLWDVATGKPYGKALALRTTTMALARVKSRTVLVTGHENGTVAVWDPLTMQPLVPPFKGHAGEVNGVSVVTAKGGSIVVSAGADGSVRSWDLS